MSDYSINDQKIKRIDYYSDKTEKIMKELFELTQEMIDNKDLFYAEGYTMATQSLIFTQKVMFEDSKRLLLSQLEFKGE
ncbi:hypothetical protein IJJ08_01830 [bacterium]|nr:hypothetical protein [bacterium]